MADKKKTIHCYMGKGWKAYVYGYKNYTGNYEDTFSAVKEDDKLGCKVCDKITCTCE